MNQLNALSATLASLMAGARECVLVDYPNHSNVGDSAIWLGEIALLKHMGIRVRALCEHTTSRQHVTALAGDSVVLIHGGGNFGDLWPQHDAFRQFLCQCLPNNKIVQLPQSLFYRERQAFDDARVVYSQHKDFHVLARDKASLQSALELNAGRASLAPDAAMCLTAKNIGVPAKVVCDIVVLARKDKESTIGDTAALASLAPKDLRLMHTDWLEEEQSVWHRIYQRASLLDVNKERLLRKALETAAVGAANALALQRVHRGARILTSGKAVVTDRLHAVVMSWILGVPVFYFDNIYNKLNSVVGCWLDQASGIHRFPSYEHALAAAAAHVRP